MTDDFTQSEVWQRAHRLVLNIYLLTEQFPPEEQLSLTQRIRETAVSIPVGVVQGGAPISAANTLAYYLLLARDLGYITGSVFEEFGEAIARLRGLLIHHTQEDTP
jgi:hypothetical protein